MTKLKLIKSKPLDEQLIEEVKEIQLSMFDIIEHEDSTWFSEILEAMEDKNVDH
jgi:hypothetical protein